MARVLLVTAGTPAATTANTTSYAPLAAGGHLELAGTESLRYIRHRTPGTLSKLFVRVTANTIDGNSTITVRQNSADTIITTTIGSSATGAFEDTTNEAAIVAADNLAYKFVPGAATNTMTIAIISVAFDADVNTVSRVAAGNTANFTTASVSRYNQLNGTISSTNATESIAKSRIRKACTAKNLAVNVSANARTTDTTVRMRKNGANGAMLITIGNVATGWFEDTTNSDTLAAGDDYGSVVETLTGTQTLTIRSICADLLTTTSHGTLITSLTAGFTQSANVTNYLNLGGALVAGTTEADRKTKARDSFTLSEITAVVTTNSVSASSTLTLRDSGVDTALLATITSNTTGVFSDSSNTAAVIDTDDLNLELTTGATGTSMVVREVSINSLGITRRIRAPATETTTISESAFTRALTKFRVLSAETITIAEQSLTRINAAMKTLSDTITIGEAIDRINGAVRTLSDTTTIGEALATIAGKIRALAAQTIVIAEDLQRIVTTGVAIEKTLSETITVTTSAMTRLKAVWRLQP